MPEDGEQAHTLDPEGHVKAAARGGRGGGGGGGTLMDHLATKPAFGDVSSSVLNSTCKNLYSVEIVE